MICIDLPFIASLVVPNLKPLCIKALLITSTLHVYENEHQVYGLYRVHGSPRDYPLAEARRADM